MHYNIAKPSEYLTQYVKHYWTMSHCLSETSQHTQRIVPSGLFELIFYLDEKPVPINCSKSFTDNTIVSGHQKDFYDIKVTGKLSLFAIYFHPYGLSEFLDLPMNELFNQSVPLKYIIKDKIIQLEDELSAVQSFEKRIAITEKFLLTQIQKNKKKLHYERIKHIIGMINRSKGAVNIDLLASESCLSRKQFERSFSDIIGASPKQFLRIIRFQNAIYQKSKYAELNLTEIAHKCGYYDQAHMVNDFKTLSGYTPGKYFSDCKPFSDYFE